MSNSKILLVDDEPLNLKLYDKMLKDFDFRIITAANGQECLDKVREHFPDLILLDWNMPVMDGIEALEILKKDDATKDIPVLMITGGDDFIRRFIVCHVDWCDRFSEKAF